MRSKRLEKHEQAEGVKLLEMLGAKVYVLGTRRKRGDHQGTMQTPGIADVLAFLPVTRRWQVFNGLQSKQTHVQVWFEFKREDGGRLTPEQAEFRDYCVTARIEHVVAHGVGDVAEYLRTNGWLR